jgi:flagellum-specific ATP synthase
MNEPVADHMRSLLDGHIVLSRDLAARAHYPSIDILQSTSRLFDKLAKADELILAKKIRKSLAVYESSRDMIELGAHKPGINLELDSAIQVKPLLDDILSQSTSTKVERNQFIGKLNSVFSEVRS